MTCIGPPRLAAAATEPSLVPKRRQSCPRLCSPRRLNSVADDERVATGCGEAGCGPLGKLNDTLSSRRTVRIALRTGGSRTPRPSTCCATSRSRSCFEPAIRTSFAQCVCSPKLTVCAPHRPQCGQVDVWAVSLLPAPAEGGYLETATPRYLGQRSRTAMRSRCFFGRTHL